MSNTVIGSSIVIEGEVTSDEDLVIEGTIRGRVATRDNLVVEEGGVVEADIEAQNVTVAGQVTGNVQAAERVEISAGGRMVGDLKAPRIHIADGAAFKGNVDMDV